MAKPTPAPAGYVPMRRGGKWIMLVESLREDGELDALVPLIEGSDAHVITRRTRREIILVAQQHRTWKRMEELEEKLAQYEGKVAVAV